MFDVGFAEILLLSLVGLLVLGPERLPKVARTLGGLARKARGSWMNLKRSIEAEMRAEELKKPLKQFENEIKSTVDQVKSGANSIKNFDISKSESTKPDSAQKPDDTDAGS
ncbi:MAG: Sec-independent protein translocase protein TatB [Xanthomonadales bacterium]|jgi:sec-independent protein translocase protein TatB|nr:Sec-independent protein translocase protein TatB [Xanthomonadales bacterium]